MPVGASANTVMPADPVGAVILRFRTQPSRLDCTAGSSSESLGSAWVPARRACGTDATGPPSATSTHTAFDCCMRPMESVARTMSRCRPAVSGTQSQRAWSAGESEVARCTPTRSPPSHSSRAAIGASPSAKPLTIVGRPLSDGKSVGRLAPAEIGIRGGAIVPVPADAAASGPGPGPGPVASRGQSAKVVTPTTASTTTATTARAGVVDRPRGPLIASPVPRGPPPTAARMMRPSGWRGSPAAPPRS